MGNRLAGKVAVVTGGASGLGAAQAILFAREGADVMIADLQADQGEAVARTICDVGGRARFARHDVASESSWRLLMDATRKEFGPLSILSNTAGVIHPGAATEESLDGWNKILSVNQTGTFLGMRAALPVMAANGGGSIVNISSLLGLLGFPGMIAYSASKGAIRTMTKAVAMECVASHIRVNTIVPGAMQTPIQANVTAEADAWQRSRIPMGDLGEPDDIAFGALYLASDEAKYVTGAELVIDGGWSVSA
ncbi:2,5-dichloro-2,5-cyclohexadiene-1,4-dioldehydrogenase [Sphingopyxis fribergensis]|uniref:2,5-dichloro-2,5-cyclohexadiene-1, 4-dioldehydrogenase n=1 Tax=Sphingopyxis fribergensis TaxID=1515612 RepID=A0A0A7PHB4_9SPHN|nr:glucose 1-dehydrogenase [Sphingopyxis fribergensis]AJA09501.1 2,5-dichloro-2,5-cyclohexadiene-1,4-dioldehydrogenase [Sphingopyxis fribergensis]